ncbi:MAG: methyltransferase domain-containing protein [Lachnospiraceae bacterium]|nr:methyltransferase domain-containing protein [Lachnospiraceae bacterium]
MQVSVMMLIDRGEEWKLTIKSVLAQTYDDLELFCINMGVSEKNSEMIKELANQNPGIRIYENVHIKDETELLNLGLSEVCGQYIMKIPNGLVLVPDAIERLMYVFGRRKNETAICADVLPVNWKGEIIQSLMFLNDEMENIYLYNPLRACLICKREVYERTGGFGRNTIYDITNDFCIRMQEEGVPMYHFRAKVAQMKMDGEWTKIKNSDNLLNLRIQKFEETVKERADFDIQMKVLRELIGQCRKCGRNGRAFRLGVYLMILQNPVNQSRMKAQRIKKHSRVAFDALADSYEQDGGYDEPRKCYMPVLKIVKKNAGKNLKLLDVGCGPGAMLQMVLEMFPDALKVDGLDLSPEMVRRANSRLTDRRSSVIEGTIDSANFPEGIYDVELCMHSFHHYPRPLKSLCCMNRVLRKKGILIIADNYYKGWKRLEQNLDLYINEYAYGDMWMYSKWELIMLTCMAGFYKQRFYKIGEKSFIFICQKR